MAFARLEPFGSHVDDLRAGVIASTIANVHRNEKVRPEPFGDLDLIVWNDTRQQEAAQAPANDGIFLEDPEAMSALINAVMFGELPEGVGGGQQDDEG
jgi:hypothetical protein